MRRFVGRRRRRRRCGCILDEAIFYISAILFFRRRFVVRRHFPSPAFSIRSQMSPPIAVRGEWLKTHVAHSSGHVFVMRRSHVIVQRRFAVEKLFALCAFESVFGLGGDVLHMSVHVLLLLLQLVEDRVAKRTFVNGLV